MYGKNVEYQGRYGLQNYDVVWVCLSFQLRDHLGQFRMGAANWLAEFCFISHNPDYYNGVGVVNLIHCHNGLVDGIGGVEADFIVVEAQGRV